MCQRKSKNMGEGVYTLMITLVRRLVIGIILDIIFILIIRSSKSKEKIP